MAKYITIVGAGTGKSKRRRRSSIASQPVRPPSKKPPKQKMPYYPETGSNKQPGYETHKKAKDAYKDKIRQAQKAFPVEPPTWDDRNISNTGTKLSIGKRMAALHKQATNYQKVKARKDNSVGQGYSGLGQVELNKRMKQHQAIARKALKKGDQYDTDMKDAYKLIGQFGSDPAFPTDAMYRSADRDFVERNKQYRIASKYKAGYDKLVGNLNY